ncbi:MAG: redoxin domain-containing protein [Candidatus Hydrogenedentes bacterium]|nr:redoxin domain-containing protein [Candidatus Hydrogenedentota bacterium]
MHNYKIRRYFPIFLISIVAIAVAIRLSTNWTFADGITVGSVMPDFKLKDYNGNEHTLSQHKGKIVVIEFCSQECPFSRGADPDLIKLYEKYKDKGVVFIGIDSHFKTTPEEIKKYATDNKKSYPILKDVENKYADLVGAKVTPEIFVIDKNGKVAYHGAFDNRSGPTGTPTEKYTENAIESLLAGKPVEKSETKAWGCTIKRVQK